jgi:methionyl-tRNA formyltransferase
MRVVFMGTPDFAVPSLQEISQMHEVTLVVTRPDAVRGRGKRLEPSPVKRAAQTLGIPVLDAKRLSAEDVERVAQERPDVICVAAYGAILSDELLAIPPLGVVNVHASLLPKGRGAAPIQRAVLEGDEVAGVSIMRIVHDLDAGPYCRQASIPVGEKPCAQVMDELARAGASELVAALEQMEHGTAKWVEQDESLVTYAAKVTKAEMLLDPKDSARANKRRVQASLDAAPARAVVAGRGVRVMQALLASVPVEQGGVCAKKGHVYLGCADGAIEVLRVKPDGKKEMPASAWASGLRGNDLAWERA